jgi:hypothetical protein
MARGEVEKEKFYEKLSRRNERRQAKETQNKAGALEKGAQDKRNQK